MWIGEFYGTADSIRLLRLLWAMFCNRFGTSKLYTELFVLSGWGSRFGSTLNRTHGNNHDELTLCCTGFWPINQSITYILCYRMGMIAATLTADVHNQLKADVTKIPPLDIRKVSRESVKAIFDFINVWFVWRFWDHSCSEAQEISGITRRTIAVYDSKGNMLQSQRTEQFGSPQ